MPRKSTSSTPGDEHPPTTQSPSPHPHQPPNPVQLPESQGQMVEATEQQIKARASIEDYLLPRSLTLRLAKSVLPPNTSIQKDAVLAIQKAATVFVSYLSSHANEATLKRTVAPSDVFSAISELEFDGFRARLEKELEAFTELKAGKRRAKKGEEEPGKEVGEEEEEEEEKDRGAKRVKRGVEKKGEEKQEDGDETQEEQEVVGNETEEEEEEEEEEEDEEEEEEHKDEEENDIDRVEDLDRDARAKRLMNPDVEGDESDSEDEDGPGSQLRGDLGLG
ncbi:histone-fold-containing protein [Aspergillus sclerotioniger CBS 115572]|uniref:DNA polymerase epsilon subunit D n=1 Tax=Aspergillus sclerotioniger CBS 115572 TaxID=1450535 RepID=A0A317WB39_9EURO|nr:histone-fold-containing protein [Aspergillus sclerotioniger CBS 115572]PWY83135.1 histone-fold-containing protein [Aspergillus sclerotioniger CBS 115572]